MEAKRKWLDQLKAARIIQLYWRKYILRKRRSAIPVVQTLLRIKPNTDDSTCLKPVTRTPNGLLVRLFDPFCTAQSKQWQYEIADVFSSDCTNRCFYNAVLPGLLQEFFYDHKDVAMLFFGAGGGKTFTLLGTKGLRIP